MTAEPFVPWPTATTVPSLMAVAPIILATPLGVLIMLHCVPFQCSENGPRGESPKASISLAEAAATASSELFTFGNGFGLGTTLQLVPSQCSITPAGWGAPGPVPTAQTLVGESAATALTPPKRNGAVGIWLQVCPFQCRLVVPPPVKSPMAQTSVLESAETPVGPLTPEKAGLETRLQLVPSQCSTKAPEGLTPTAQALFDAGAVTPRSSLPFGSLGLETTLQLVPSQGSINVFSEDNMKGFTLPTAHTSLLAAPATPKKAAFPEGVETTLQLVPSKCSASV